MKTLALIPARSGSKRFKNKNRAELNGKPLLAWTLESALKSKVLDRIVLSSDDDAILALGQPYVSQGVTLQKRPAELASDQATAAQVLAHTLAQAESQGEHYDACCLLLPTCPFRSAEDIQNSLALLDKSFDSVVSMRESATVPQFMFQRGEQGRAHSLLEDTAVFSGKTRKQDYEALYYPNGAIYWAWTDKFLAHGGFYCNDMAIYPMPEFRSVDIDIEEDLVYAHAIWERFLAKNSV